MSTELKTFYADVSFNLYNVEFKAPEDTEEWMLKEMADEAAVNKLVGLGADSVDVDIDHDEED